MMTRRSRQRLAVTLRDLIPRQQRTALQDAYFLLRALPYRGEAVECPCCGWHLKSFMQRHEPQVTRVLPSCPRCHSNERHRWLWLYLRDRRAIQTAHLRVLHFAPEFCFYRALKSLPNLDWIGTDLADTGTGRIRVQQDITQIVFPDASFDAILCSHVLEHVPDDRRAMAELFRVLKPGGWAVLAVPIRMDQPTYEDFSITDPAERVRAFGQSDHVRWYGADFVDRLQAAGFAVEAQYARDLPPDTIQRYGLEPSEVMFICTRPADT